MPTLFFYSMKHKILFLFFISAFVIFSLGSCKKSDKPKGPQPTEFEQGMNAKDTLEVKQLVDKFFSYVKAKNFNEAAAMLYRNDEGDNHEPSELDNEQMEKVKGLLEAVPMIDYEIEYIKFDEAYDNEVLCNVIIAEAHDDMPAMKTKMFFKPIKVMDKWGLCLMNTEYGDRGVVTPDKRDSVEKDYAKKDSTRHKITQ